MFQPSTLSERYASKESRLVLLLTTGVTFTHGIAIALRFFLREKNSQTFGLSGIEWIAFTVGPFLVSPILLFGLLYYISTRADRLPTVSSLLPGLFLSVVVGTYLGQFVGEQLFQTGWTPLAQARIDVLLTPDLRSAPYWRDLLEPPIRSVLTAVAAVALARTSTA